MFTWLSESVRNGLARPARLSDAVKLAGGTEVE